MAEENLDCVVSRLHADVLLIFLLILYSSCYYCYIVIIIKLSLIRNGDRHVKMIYSLRLKSESEKKKSEFQDKSHNFDFNLIILTFEKNISNIYMLFF